MVKEHWSKSSKMYHNLRCIKKAQRAFYDADAECAKADPLWAEYAQVVIDFGGKPDTHREVLDPVKEAEEDLIEQGLLELIK